MVELRERREKKMYYNNTRKTFTLIELLVVITIISILAGMMLPVLQKAVKSARRISCMNNLKQVSMGFGLYTDDFAVYPYPNRKESDNLWYQWRFHVSRYMRNDPARTDYFSMRTFWCPAYDLTQNHHPYYSYAMNWYLRYRRPAIARKPTAILLSGDLIEIPSDYNIFQNNAANIAFRHSGTANFLFMDSHVKGLTVNYQPFYGGPPNVWRESLTWN